jgi:replication factor A1
MIKDITPTSRNINIMGKVISIQQPHEFTRKDGSKGKVGSFILLDNSESIRVVILDDKTQLLTEKSFLVGKEIVIENGYCKVNTFKSQAEIEVHVGKFSQISLKK